MQISRRIIAILLQSQKHLHNVVQLAVGIGETLKIIRRINSRRRLGAFRLELFRSFSALLTLSRALLKAI